MKLIKDVVSANFNNITIPSGPMALFVMMIKYYFNLKSQKKYLI